MIGGGGWGVSGTKSGGSRIQIKKAEGRGGGGCFVCLRQVFTFVFENYIISRRDGVLFRNIYYFREFMQLDILEGYDVGR